MSAAAAEVRASGAGHAFLVLGRHICASGAETRSSCRGELVLVDEAAEQDGRRRLDVRARWSYVCRLVSSTALPGEGGALATGGTVGGFLAAWLAHMRGRVRRVTFEGYEVLVRRHALPALGALELAALRPLHLQDLYGRLLAGGPGRRPLAAGTVLNLHLVLTQALGQAVRWELLGANPAAGAQPPGLAATCNRGNPGSALCRPQRVS